MAFYAYAFVNASGVVSFRLCDSYAVGEIYDTPEKLLTADEIRTKFEKDNARREKDGIGRPTFTGAQLMYMPMRAARKKDGMVFAPVWYIQYDWLDVTQPCDGWALVFRRGRQAGGGLLQLSARRQGFRVLKYGKRACVRTGARPLSPCFKPV